MTERQLDVLNFIKDFIKVKGFSPSYTDIAKGLGMSSKSNIHRPVSYTHLTLPTNREV